MKHKRNRFQTGIHAGSMADIAFLLLIFFLVTTTIVQDEGILVKLPPYDPDPVVPEVLSRNILRVVVNASGAILVDKEEVTLDVVAPRLVQFIRNPNNDLNLAKDPKQAIVSLIHDRGTLYEDYIGVYNALKQGYRELWDGVAQERYALPYNQLEANQQRAVRRDFPMVLSEAEPSDLALK